MSGWSLIALDPWFFPAAAFWWAVLSFGGPSKIRFWMGLALGGVLARLLWAGLHFPLWFEAPWSLIDRTGGFCVLALPLGPFLLAPCRSTSAAARSYRAHAARALIPALALARMGCVWLGCCGGRVEIHGWTHPVALYEAVFWLGLACVMPRIPDRQAPGLWLFAFGAVRLLLEPLRAAPPLGPPELRVGWIALAWLSMGLVMLVFDGRETEGPGGRGPSRSEPVRSSSPVDPTPRGFFARLRRLVGWVSCPAR